MPALADNSLSNTLLLDSSPVRFAVGAIGMLLLYYGWDLTRK